MFVSESLRNGYILQVAAMSDYASYNEFQDAIRALPVSIDLCPVPIATLTTLDGTQMEVAYGQPPKIDGETVDFSSWKLFDGPFSQSSRESERLEITHGSEKYILDFQNNSITSTPSEQ